MKNLICLIVILFFSVSLLAQEATLVDKQKDEKLTQVIRGVVKDASTDRPIAYASIILLTTQPMQSVYTDSLGVFRFEEVSLGRHDLEISFIGYEPIAIKEILLASAKESYNEVFMNASALSMDEITVFAKVNKEKPLNQMALSGARMISVEEASRYAGGFDDPARLVSSFAGVAGSTTSNSISVHGNSPQFLQWKIEGIEVPNPTHFADLTGVGGGVITALSSHVMGNSDFFNGAFPAEYNNALSGVFDMSMRTGNNQQYEHTAQLGILGIDLASEGPISKKNGSSYIINYRYSITELISSVVDDLSLKFQDLSFKFNFPTRKAGTFSLWGIGLIDAYSLDNDVQTNSRDAGDIDMKKAVLGVGHRIPVGKNAYIKTSLAATYADTRQYLESKDENEIYIPVIDMKNREMNIVFSSYLNKKFGARHTNRTGVTVTGLFYDLDYSISSANDEGIDELEKFAFGDAATSMISVFSNSLINITDRLSTSVGVTGQFFSLNNSWAVEPRVSFNYNVASRHNISIAYGLHSRREKLEYYYVKLEKEGEFVNRDLKFARANHFVLSYGWSITKHLHLRVEPYYQYLYDVPVEPNSWFSIINFQGIGLANELVNGGKGKNYGIDITLERYLNKGYYWLLTGSVFRSRYAGGDGIWRNTVYDRNFIINALGGKEWMVGKGRQNVISANVRFLFQGGKRFTPIDKEASDSAGTTIYDTDKIFDSQFPASLTVDVTFGYKLNRRRVSHEFSLKILNVTGTPERYDDYYNQNSIMKDEVTIILPNISYKIHF